jgi:hypothetical protein
MTIGRTTEGDEKEMQGSTQDKYTDSETHEGIFSEILKSAHALKSRSIVRTDHLIDVCIFNKRTDVAEFSMSITIVSLAQTPL